MNKTRRKELRDITKEIKRSMEMLSKVLGDEQEYYDNIPDNLQGTERAEESETVIGELEEVLDNINNAIEIMEEI